MTALGGASRLMELLGPGTPMGRNRRGAGQAITGAIGAGGVLLVDEAQNLLHRNLRGKDERSTFAWLRALSEDGCLSILFSGAFALPALASELPQLWSRLRRPFVLRRTTGQDVELLAARRGVEDSEAVAALYRVVRRGAGLRDVDSAIAHAPLRRPR